MGETMSIGRPAQDIKRLDRTVTELGNAGVYTGDFKSTEGFGKIVGSVLADQTGTLHIEQSQDASTVHHRTSYTISANDPDNGGYAIDVVAPWVRMRYVNDATPQTSFALEMNGRVN